MILGLFQGFNLSQQVFVGALFFVLVVFFCLVIIRVGFSFIYQFSWFLGSRCCLSFRFSALIYSVLSVPVMF